MSCVQSSLSQETFSILLKFFSSAVSAQSACMKCHACVVLDVLIFIQQASALNVSHSDGGLFGFYAITEPSDTGKVCVVYQSLVFIIIAMAGILDFSQ